MTAHETAHIGIVACSAEGAALCYRTICAEGPALLGANEHPEVSLHGHSLRRYVDLLDAGDLAGVGELMLDSAHRVAAAGAEFVICPDNSIHQALPFVLERSPVPWVHIAATVADEAAARGFRRVGLLGTRWLVDSDLYTIELGAHGIDAVRPTESDRDTVHDVIMNDLVPGRAGADAVACIELVIDRLHAVGCDAIALACTELPLVVDDTTSSLPTLDSTRLLARAALRRATAASRSRDSRGWT